MSHSQFDKSPRFTVERDAEGYPWFSDGERHYSAEKICQMLNGAQPSHVAARQYTVQVGDGKPMPIDKATAERIFGVVSSAPSVTARTAPPSFTSSRTSSSQPFAV